MPSYEFVCENCGMRRDVRVPLDQHGTIGRPTCACGSHMRRRFTPFGFARSNMFETHFNRSVGAVVSNQAQFRAALSRKSDEMSERMNQDVDYQPVDPGEPAAYGVNVEQAKEQARKAELGKGVEPRVVA